MGFGVWGLGFGVWGLGFGVWGLGFGVWGLGLFPAGKRGTAASLFLTAARALKVPAQHPKSLRLRVFFGIFRVHKSLRLRDFGGFWGDF